ncbi:N-6 DNA methylase [Caldilinea sp.]|uniref:N-6 DNA methylase n=1 Tax=Caldilinea sp. TaxID=2293560 RepID=UPI002C768852|nr:N-6 DNA methylase [Caldilinea sp.]HRA66729.1 N-6 DNA methylase [Caldilinea sp.]
MIQSVPAARTLVLFPDWTDVMLTINTLTDLLAIAVALGAKTVVGWSDAEEELTAQLPCTLDETVATIAARIVAGEDPLGELYCQILSPAQRRPSGATYTPAQFVHVMTQWAVSQVRPKRVVDPGCGSGRFLVAAGKCFEEATLIGIETDPVAAMLARANLAVNGFVNRAKVTLVDYREVTLEEIDGATLFIGNPPYVRHHDIAPEHKAWLTDTAQMLGIRASQLAGLHAHFFLATALLVRPGDLGVFITSSEWLDVNYGELLRRLLTGPLKVLTIQVINPRLQPFPGTATTAVITGFAVSTDSPLVAIGRVEQLDDLKSLHTDVSILRAELAALKRWSALTSKRTERRAGFIELGEICRVHRGQVTGANKVWVARKGQVDLPTAVLWPAITRAQELFHTTGILDNIEALKLVIDLPAELDAFSVDDQARIAQYLKFAAAKDADATYIARHRTPWWSVKLHAPAPILATYMARRTPVFVYNRAKVRHINIAHGLYPREPLSVDILMALARFLTQSVTTDEGRTYAGGLTKFEPREMERLLIPHPDLLVDPQVVEELLQ